MIISSNRGLSLLTISILIASSGILISSCQTRATPPMIPNGINKPQVIASTDKQSYFSHEEITIHVINALLEDIEYDGSCSLSLCQQSEGDWICEMKECDGEEIILKAGDSIRFQGLPPDQVDVSLRYRFEYYVIPTRMLSVANSNIFTINK
jgi:hypothetical protein